jgi:predicted transposase/invertase (TIGR01784 family)
MKTDTLFYQLFQSFHSLLFELIDRPISEAEGYRFSSAEVKEKAFRFDGIFTPTTNDKPIFLIEVQFQPKEDFYWEFLSEIFLYLNQYRPTQNWQAVAIFARRSIEPEITHHFQDIVASPRIVRVYLEDWLDQKTNSLGIAIIQLILASPIKTIALAQDLADKIEEAVDPALQEQVVKFIETVLVYKFPKLSRQEIETMFNYSDLKKTRVYQEAKEEGLQIGLQKVLQGQISMLQRMLTRKFGQLSPRTSSKISKLSAIQLENLADVIFDLQTITELNAWLRKNS